MAAVNLLDYHVPYEMQTIEKGKLKVPLKNTPWKFFYALAPLK